MPDKIQDVIERHIQTESKAMIYFKLNGRSPLYGQFIKANDTGELWKKGYFRFVPGNRSEIYERTKNLSLTSLFNLSSLVDVKIYI